MAVGQREQPAAGQRQLLPLRSDSVCSQPETMGVMTHIWDSRSCIHNGLVVEWNV